MADSNVHRPGRLSGPAAAAAASTAGKSNVNARGSVLRRCRRLDERLKIGCGEEDAGPVRKFTTQRRTVATVTAAQAAGAAPATALRACYV